MSVAAPEATGDVAVTARADRERRLLLPAVAMLLVAVALQVLFVPALALGSAPPAVANLVIVVVVAIAVKRGVTVGAIAGFAGGFLTELLMPGRSLGAIAFASVIVGAWCGRFADPTRRMNWWLFTTIAAGAGGFVPFMYGIIDLLRGVGLPLDVLIPTIAVPHLTFAALMAPIVWWVAQRLLGVPQVVEPGMMAE